MAEPSDDVKKFFSGKLASWKNALSNWRKKCQGVQEEHRKLQRSRDLVSERTPFADRPQLGSPLVTRSRSNATFSDAIPPPKPSSASVETEERIAVVGKRAKRCDEMLRRIEKMISRFNDARVTGKWTFDKQKTQIRKKKNFIGGKVADIEPGEVLEVLKVEGDWLWVRNSSGVEGWSHRSDGMPDLPIELTSKPGDGKQMTREEWEKLQEDASNIMTGRG